MPIGSGTDPMIGAFFTVRRYPCRYVRGFLVNFYHEPRFMANYSVMDHFFSFGIAYITGGLVFIGIIVTCFTILQEKFHTFGMLTINDWHVGEILRTRASGTR